MYRARGGHPPPRYRVVCELCGFRPDPLTDLIEKQEPAYIELRRAGAPATIAATLTPYDHPLSAWKISVNVRYVTEFLDERDLCL